MSKKEVEYGNFEDLLTSEELVEEIIPYKGKQFLFKRKKEICFEDVVNLLVRVEEETGGMKNRDIYPRMIDEFYPVKPEGWDSEKVMRVDMVIIGKLLAPLPSMSELLGEGEEAEEIRKKRNGQ